MVERFRWRDLTLLPLALVAVIAVAPSLSGGPAALALASGTEAEDLPGETALEADARVVADQMGVTVDTALRWLHEQQTFDDLQSDLERRYDTFAGAWTSHGKDAEYLVRFKDAVPSGASDLAAAFGLTVTMIGGSPYLEAELQTRAEELHNDLLALGFEEVAYAYSVESQVVVAAISSPTDETERVGSLLPYTRSPDYSVHFVPGPVSESHATYGGAWLRDYPTNECTSGFTVKVPGTTETGVVTAGHCDGLNQYVQPSNGQVYSAPWRVEHVGAYGDMEYHAVISSTGLPYF